VDGTLETVNAWPCAGISGPADSPSGRTSGPFAAAYVPFADVMVLSVPQRLSDGS
jgi:hypothetical protein